jgi:hypothetical protein
LRFWETQEPICEILAKIALLLGLVEKLSFFDFFFQRKMFFASFLFELIKINGYQGWDEILMITLISSKKLGGYKDMRNTVSGFLTSPVLVVSTHLLSFFRFPR